jgi:TRAP-type C4-dicarboxylate transport system permease small subunit
LRATLRKLDAALYRAEKFLAGALFLGMVLVMFASVMQRIYASPQGRLSAAVLALLRRMGQSPDPATIHGPVSSALNFVLALLLCYGALRTMRLETPLSRAKALGLAALGGAALSLLLWTFLSVFPNGLPWGPGVSLACVLWVGFLGASLATYEKRHLVLEMGEKIWPKAALPYVRALAAASTAGLCLLLWCLAYLSLKDHYHVWAVSHLTGIVQASKIPVWAVFLIFPYAFAVMGLRFLGTGVSALVDREASVP